ncbi:MAG: hypothetical protein LBQ50_03020 [Planctomycetaceae bacterium]|nr:hypothetical protein [Planctomycetaceae bacterium]
MMHNRRCSVAQPPDNRNQQPKSRSDDIIKSGIGRKRRKRFLYNNADNIVAARLCRWGMTRSGDCATLHHRLCIITSLARLISILLYRFNLKD